jgi:hypothetical protein
MPMTKQTTKRWSEYNDKVPGSMILYEETINSYPDVPNMNPPSGPCVELSDDLNAIIDRLDKLVNLSAEMSEKLSKIISALSTP